MAKQAQIEVTLDHLFEDSKYDMIKAMKGMVKSAFRPITPSNFKDVYLSISKEQGEGLIRLISENDIKNIVEFGTSFGISTLFLAKGALETHGHIITTELIKSKAKKAIENFKLAGVENLIDVRIGDAVDTLKDHEEPVDLLLLDGWKDLYLTVFNILEPNFHEKSLVYVDNADMAETKVFLTAISQNTKYKLESMHQGKVVLISRR